MERVVGPADCALAIALPLTRDEFVRDAADAEHDFARSVVRRSGLGVEAAWRDHYEPRIVRLCGRVIERARALGATVVTAATSAALASLLERFPVVSVVGHTVLSPIRAADLLDPADALATIWRGESMVAARLRPRVASEFASDAAADPGAALGERLAHALDASLDEARAWYGSTARVEATAAPVFHLNRVMLEDCLGPALRRSGVLELRDGIKAIDELLAMIPGRFAGVLDLSVCNSVALGESIKRRRPRCLIVESAFLARIDVRLARSVLVLGYLARAPSRYTDALHEVGRLAVAGELWR